MSHLNLGELQSIAQALGISTDGKSADALAVLLKEAAQKPPSAIDPDALSKHFEEGRFTDCQIRVKVGDASDDAVSGPATKRARTGRRGKGAGKAAAAAEDEDVRVIKAHAVILASRSAYFERAMGGQWRESQDKSLEVNLSDEEEYVTFLRLIKLCYGTTFTKDGDRDLGVRELVRLIHVADAFECMDAIKQCTGALEVEFSKNWTSALEGLEIVEMSRGVTGMAALGLKATAAVVKGLGRVHELFTPSDETDKPGVLGGLKLADRVKDLPPARFEAVLSSKRLQLQTENEAFWLLLAWVEAQSDESEEGKQALFTRMTKHLRFDAMDPAYVLLLVCDHPRIIAAGLQTTVLRTSLNRANNPKKPPKAMDGYGSVGARSASLPVGRDRGRSGKVSWSTKVELSAAAVTSVRQGHSVKRTVGLLAGMPWVLTIDQTQTAAAAGGAETDHRLNIRCDSPFDYATGQRTGFVYTCTVFIQNQAFVRMATLKAEDIASWTEREQGNGWILPKEVFQGANPAAVQMRGFTLTVTV